MSSIGRSILALVRGTCWGVIVFGASLPASAQEKPGIPLDELLNTPVSTAAQYEQRLTDAPASVTVITAEEISRYGWETLAEVLNAVRGIYIRYDRDYEYLGIRGVSGPTDFNNRLLVMIDGQSSYERACLWLLAQDGRTYLVRLVFQCGTGALACPSRR